MLKKQFFFKKYKLNKLQKIQKTFKYIYFFRYNDLTINEIIRLKKLLKKLHYKLLILHQNLNTQIFFKLKGQGSILIIYGNKDLSLIKNLIKYPKLNLIYLKIHQNIFSIFKIKKVLLSELLPLNNLIVSPFLNFIYLLRKI